MDRPAEIESDLAALEGYFSAEERPPLGGLGFPQWKERFS